MSPANRWGRFADWDARPLRLDRFAREDPAKGFAAMKSPADPRPAVFDAVATPAAVAGLDDVRHALDGGAQVIDARGAAHLQRHHRLDAAPLPSASFSASR